MSDKLYYRNTSDYDTYGDWREMIISKQYDTSFNFKHYDFKLNDIIYTCNSLEWQKEIRKQQLWANLEND